jgi:hypothetical protein
MNHAKPYKKTIGPWDLPPVDPTEYDPQKEGPKIPAWKVVLGVLVFCGAFWAAVAYLVR